MSYHDVSPTSPLSPLSPSLLPQWLRPARPRGGLFPNGRVRVVLIATGCMTLGWLVTSALSPSSGTDFGMAGDAYDPSSLGILTDPTGFGSEARPDQDRPGILYPSEIAANDGEQGSKEPSVKGALADLHHAVSDKLQSWNPYHATAPFKLPSMKNESLPWPEPKKENNSILITNETQVNGNKDDLGAKTRIGKCTILFNSNSYYERALRSHELHDRQHGYRLNILRQGLMDDVWSKPAYVLSLLLRELSKPEHERLEWLMWVDADTIILNPYVPIDIFLPPPGPEFEDVHLVYSNDWNGLNNGVFPVRVNQWAVQLFSAVLAYRHYQPEADLTFRDQSAMHALIHDPKFEKNIVEAPQRWFNAYQGEHNETLAPFQIRRDVRMGYWLDREEQHLEDWEIPLKSTSYPVEAKDFWNSQREARKNRKEALAEIRLKATEVLTNTEIHMSDYGERLDDNVKEVIGSKKEALKTMVDNEQLNDDFTKLETGITELENALGPLTQAMSTSHKLLINSAHEAIFAGEKDLTDGGYSHGITNPEMEQISAAVKHLKGLVMLPEDQWNKNGITAATNAVTEARAKLQEKAGEVTGDASKITAEKAAKAKAYEEAKKLVDEQIAEEKAAAQGLATSSTAELAIAAPESSQSNVPATNQVVMEWVTQTQEIAVMITEGVLLATQTSVVPADWN